MPNEIVKKGQFVELDMTARISQTGEVFDTTDRKEAEKAKMDPNKIKPLIMCVGESMVPSGLDNSLEGKEVGKEYAVELQPKEAFGERIPSLVKIIPLNLFRSKGISPYPGMALNMDGLMARITAVSGGRVTTDFNNPLSGKKIAYSFKIKRIVNDGREKINCLVEFFLRADPSKVVESADDKKAVLKVTSNFPEEILKGALEKMSKLSGIKIESANEKAESMDQKS